MLHVRVQEFSIDKVGSPVSFKVSRQKCLELVEARAFAIPLHLAVHHGKGFGGGLCPI
jgi:hypothetical protein